VAQAVAVQLLQLLDNQSLEQVAAAEVETLVEVLLLAAALVDPQVLDPTPRQ
jgi:hypothetical protein